MRTEPRGAEHHEDDEDQSVDDLLVGRAWRSGTGDQAEDDRAADRAGEGAEPADDHHGEHQDGGLEAEAIQDGCRSR